MVPILSAPSPPTLHTADAHSPAWRTKPAHQPVTYPSAPALLSATAQLRALPPIVTAPEIHRLRAALARAARGEALVLQGGDCAELFAYCEAGKIDAKLKLLLQMSLVLVYGARRPVVRIGRIAGQYAKPRSSPVEKVAVAPAGGKGEEAAKTVEVPSFRGDILNGYPVEERAIDPARLVAAYWHSAATMNYARAQLASGMADLHSPMDWGLGHVRDDALQKKYARIVESIRDSLSFMQTVGADSVAGGGPLSTVDLYTSHEGLVLEYEEALVRRMKRPADESTGRWSGRKGEGDDGFAHYATSAHFLWIGDRTRQLDGAHVEFFRGLANPIGIKVGPSMAGDELARLLDVVDPDREPGRVTLITRYGADKVERMLGAHIEAVRRSGHVVVWQCDPMHGCVNPPSLPSSTSDQRGQEHALDGDGRQDALVRRHLRRARGRAAHPPPARELPRRHAPRADGRRRDRVRRRERGPRRGGPQPQLHDLLRPAAQREAGAGAGVLGRGSLSHGECGAVMALQKFASSADIKIKVMISVSKWTV
jgi:3-deoxy-7-phosphoheptulonate synthase